MVDSDSGQHTPFFTRVVFVVFYTRRFYKVPRFVLRDLQFIYTYPQILMYLLFPFASG